MLFRDERKGRLILLTAPKNPGSSGGAVLNEDADVITRFIVKRRQMEKTSILQSVLITSKHCSRQSSSAIYSVVTFLGGL